jgi:hypothetical protein
LANARLIIRFYTGSATADCLCDGEKHSKLGVTSMKKWTTLAFASVFALVLSMPAWSQSTTGTTNQQTAAEKKQEKDAKKESSKKKKANKKAAAKKAKEEKEDAKNNAASKK